MSMVEWRWAFEFEGETYYTDDLTFDELSTVETLTGEGWRNTSPQVADHVPALLFVFLTRSMSDDEAKAKVVGLRVSDVKVKLLVNPIPV